MARLIDIEDVQNLPLALHLRMGDLLIVKASGGFVKEGETNIEQLGPFIPGLLQKDGSIISPSGSPNTVMFLAREVGWAVIVVTRGDPFFFPQLVEIEIRVDS